MRDSLRQELSQNDKDEDEHLLQIEHLQEVLFAELEKVRHIVTDPVGQRQMKKNYQEIKSSVESLVELKKQLSTLVRSDLDLKNKVTNLEQYFQEPGLL